MADLKNIAEQTAQWLVLLAALNWGLQIFNVNLVTWIQMLVPQIQAMWIYGLVGISAVYLIYKKFKR